MKYRFDHPDCDAVFVMPDQLYMPPAYGFLTEENRQRAKRLQILELNSGFEPVYWCQGRELTRICADGHGVYVHWTGEGELPLTFAADVPAEGNYRVGITLYAETAVDVMIFLGRRRLAWRGMIAGLWQGTFVTNICPVIPRTYEEPLEARTLHVTVLGRGVRLAAVEAEPWDGRTLYIAGDSTVTDQSADYPYLPGRSYCGWGQMLPAFLGTQMAVSNHAHSGLTTESFRTEGHYQILYERLREGDVCLMQFGHNDQKLMHLAAEGGYRENLIRYIEEIRGKGAAPVLVTPLARNSWRGDDGSYNDLLASYADACARLAEEYQVPLLDLHGKSMEFVTACGREKAMRYFFPGDYTHSNDYGAYRYAGYVYGDMVRSGLAIRGEETVCGGSAACGGNIEKPDVEASGILTRTMEYAGETEPPVVLPELRHPKVCGEWKDPNEERLFEDLERTDEDMTRVDALEMVSAALHFFPTNVYNDMFEDVIGLQHRIPETKRVIPQIIHLAHHDLPVFTVSRRLIKRNQAMPHCTGIYRPCRKPKLYIFIHPILHQIQVGFVLRHFICSADSVICHTARPIPCHIHTHGARHDFIHQLSHLLFIKFQSCQNVLLILKRDSLVMQQPLIGVSCYLIIRNITIFHTCIIRNPQLRV